MIKDDYYALLAVPRTASQAQLKQAYHRALLRFHPDKHHASTHDAVDAADMITQVKQAYATLSSDSARAQYDASVAQRANKPRPAQVISLDNFIISEETSSWHHACRCGAAYSITNDDLEHGVHLVGCEGCSEVIWVGYEVVEDDAERTAQDGIL
jgi:diphthamide biosynthesis protein 4